MMPSAAIENCSSAPPDSRFTHPKTSCICAKNSPRATPSMPGVGMTTTARYTASMAKVNSSRRRSSGMRPALANPSSTFDHLGAAAGCGDALLSRFAEGMRLHRQRFGQLALAENLDRPAAAHQALLEQRGRVDHGAGGEGRLEPAQVHDAELPPERVVEAALGQAALQRHLPTLEPRVRIAAGARAATLVPAARGLAETGAWPAAEPLALLARAGRRGKGAEIHRPTPPRAPSAALSRSCPASGRPSAPSQSCRAGSDPNRAASGAAARSGRSGCRSR